MSASQALKRLNRPLRILAIETSCDDTAVSIMDSSRNILSDKILHQHAIHAATQGIVPALASHGHKRILPFAVEAALTQADMEVADIDVFAATRGPGIAGCLTVGYEAGRLLSTLGRKPFYAVHHMEAHALAARLGQDIAFPFLCLLISGGHTLLLLVKGLGDYVQLGTTVDDSVGEAIDKAARTIGFPYDPVTGPAHRLVQAAFQGTESGSVFPNLKSRRIASSMDFSFSGLKTALLEKCQSMATISDQDRCDLARAFLNACADHIADRLKKSISLIRSEKMRHENLSIVLGGGVARNDYLYNRYLGYIYSTNIFRLAVLLQSENCALIRPAPKLCVDNATMIAWAALEYINSNIDPQKYDTVCQDWPLQDLKLNTWRNILS